jgi:uncharacterized surface protein with fasciclin (FAS1) repeats
MKNYFLKSSYLLDKLQIILVIGILLFASCTDNYLYDKQEPSFLGASIYDYLKTDGHFTTYVKLIDDLGYRQVLQLTGSKTLFVAKDSAFNQFYLNNSWGVKRYEELTLAQKKMLLNYSMINNAYLMQFLSSYFDPANGSHSEGTAMRRLTALSAIDSIPFEYGDKLPTSSYWDYYRVKGIHVLKDNTEMPIVYFTPAFMTKLGMNTADYKILFGNQTPSADESFVFNHKIIKQDITCKNGYVHVVDGVLLPPVNMAQYIQDNSDPALNPEARTSIFSRLLDRFSAPYYDASNTILYKTLHPEFTDSIFVKHYFARTAKSLNNGNGGNVDYIGGALTYPKTGLPVANLLPYDPGWNSYANSNISADMATMFVPTDKAMMNYLTTGVFSLFLKGDAKNNPTWDSIPDNIVLPLLKRHMRASLLESLPSRFSKMIDDVGYNFAVTSSDIKKSYTAVNGEVYVTDKVYPPVDYISVYSPVLLSSNSKVMNWAINITQTGFGGSLFAFYKLYLNSLDTRYSMFIPTDGSFLKKTGDSQVFSCVDPVAYGQTKAAFLKFWINNTTKTKAVNCTLYLYDKLTATVGDSVGVITDQGFIQNRLWDILDSHIVVGTVNANKKYYITKANDIIVMNDFGGNSMSVQGGGDLKNDTKCNVTNTYNLQNGSTYFIDKPIQPSLKSVYRVLSEIPQFSMFYNLLTGVPDTCVTQIFSAKGIDQGINFYRSFHYTLYVPTNEAIQNALNNHTIATWDSIYKSDPADKGRQIRRMVRFLKYHFQDNAVFFGQNINDQYQTATIKDATDNNSTYWGTSINKYFKVGVSGTSNSLQITMDSKQDALGIFPIRTAHVSSDPALHNLIAKDYIFSGSSHGYPTEFKNIDNTGNSNGMLFKSSLISSSASTVIHQIDQVLTFE